MYVDVDMSDFDDINLVEELEQRGKLPKGYSEDPDGFYKNWMDHDKLKLIKKILGLKDFESIERVTEEIRCL
jgi:hypothetical protein